MAATERGNEALVSTELSRAANSSESEDGAKALVSVALSLGDPATAVAILERALKREPDNVDALRLLVSLQHQRHRMREVAALDEQIYTRNGDIDTLRDAADIYASRHMTAERIDALRRLSATDRATAAETSELAHRLSDASAGAEALTLVLRWLNAQTGPVGPDVIAIAATLSAATPDAETIAAQLGTLIGRAGLDGPLHVLVQTYAERGRPQLSLVAARAIGETMQARPDIAILIAQLEAMHGDYDAARQRLAALDRAGMLTPAGTSMLAELSLQHQDYSRAVELLRSLTTEQIPEELPLQVVQTLHTAGRLDLLNTLAIEPIGSVSPASGAVMALARGDRANAAMWAQQALGPSRALADFGPAFGDVIRVLGMERVASARLLEAQRAGPLQSDALALLLEVAASPRVDGPALLRELRSQRDLGAGAGVAWATVATLQGKGGEVALWLQSHGGQMPTQSLLSLLLAAVGHNDASLAHAAGSALAGRLDLQDGWTSAEVAFASHAMDAWTTARLREGLALIGAPGTARASRNRIAAILASARNISQLARQIRPLPENDAAVVWLASAVDPPERSELAAARLALLTLVAPQQALGPLSQLWARDARRLLPLYVGALLDVGRAAEAEAALSAGLHDLTPAQQDAVLFELSAKTAPQNVLNVLRVGAKSGRADWVASYQDALAHAGLVEELRADLRARGAAPGLDTTRREAVASRLVELNDRSGAIAILKTVATGMRPENPTVEQLLYLWGPRDNPDAIAWTREQAAAAPLADLPKWLDHLAYLAAPRDVIELVTRRPAVLGASVSAVRTYEAALITSKIEAKPDLRTPITATNTPDRLVALAQLALDTGQAAVAWQAAQKAVVSVPNDKDALRLAAQSAAAVHRSDDAASLYTRLLAQGPQPVEVLIDAGDAFLAAKRIELGQHVLSEALKQSPSEPTTLSEARRRARILVLLRRNSDAVLLLKLWLDRNPDHTGLRADLLQIRLSGGSSL